jgi:hypothetical protein
MLYSLIRVVLDAIATSHSNEAELRAEVLALRRQVQVLPGEGAASGRSRSDARSYPNLTPCSAMSRGMLAKSNSKPYRAATPAATSGCGRPPAKSAISSSK